MRGVLMTFLPLVVLAGCGAREAQPVAEHSPLDDRLTCAHLQGELATNRARLAELGEEAERRGRDSIGTVLLIGVAGAMFVDTGNTQKTETEALARRNSRLEALAAQRGCSL